MFDKLKTSVTTRFAPTREHLSGLKADLRDRLRGFRSNRSPALQKSMEEDFVRLLDAWGIFDERAIPGVLRDMRLRCLLLALPVIAAICAAVIAISTLNFLILALVAPPCVFGITATLWRMSILRRRAFVPFGRWLIGFIRKNQRGVS
jgi:hypothetical protein